MRRDQKRFVAELQQLDAHSIDFYDLASRYFCRRLRVIHSCGLFFICVAVISCAAFVMALMGHSPAVGLLLGSIWFAFLGGISFQIVKKGFLPLNTARKANFQVRLIALRSVTNNFKGDPVANMVLELLQKKEKEKPEDTDDNAQI